MSNNSSIVLSLSSGCSLKCFSCHSSNRSKVYGCSNSLDVSLPHIFSPKKSAPLLKRSIILLSLFVKGLFSCICCLNLEFYDIWLKIFHNISGIVCDRNCFRYFVIYNYISSTFSFSLIFPNVSYWSQGIVSHLNENFTSSKVGFFFIFTRFFRYSFNSFLFFR